MALAQKETECRHGIPKKDVPLSHPTKVPERLLGASFLDSDGPNHPHLRLTKNMPHLRLSAISQRMTERKGAGGDPITQRFSFLAYLTPVGTLVALLCRFKNSTVRFHCLQSFLLWVLVYLAVSALSVTDFFQNISVVTEFNEQLLLGSMLFFCTLGMLSAFLYALLGVWLGTPSPLPLIGQIALLLSGYEKKVGKEEDTERETITIHFSKKETEHEVDTERELTKDEGETRPADICAMSEEDVTTESVEEEDACQALLIGAQEKACGAV